MIWCKKVSERGEILKSPWDKSIFDSFVALAKRTKCWLAQAFVPPYVVQLYIHNAQVHWQQRWKEQVTERLTGERLPPVELQYPLTFESALNQLHFPIVLNMLPSNITSVQWLCACACVCALGAARGISMETTTAVQTYKTALCSPENCLVNR